MEMRTLMKKTAVRQLHASEAASDIEIAFWLQDWDDPYNVGGMFRVADAVGAEEMILTGKTPQPPHPQISVTSLGHHRRVPFRHFPRHDDAAKTLKEEGWSLIAVEIASEAQHYMHFEYPAKTCFVLGNEGAGLYGNVVKACEAAVFIPMAGKGRSVNVHVAAAIVAFEARLRLPHS
ncbi:TrmH family RNA methyltransferase [bacterium]|nr:MAG: TrmH family RNA methyltransferase [bacterium]